MTHKLNQLREDLTESRRDLKAAESTNESLADALRAIVLQNDRTPGEVRPEDINRAVEVLNYIDGHSDELPELSTAGPDDSPAFGGMQIEFPRMP